MRLAKTILLAGTALLIAAPAAAQKSKDTLRLAINDPFTVLSAYYVPVDEAGNFYRKVYQSLIAFDEHTGKVVPLLAKSWTRVNPTTIDFELFDNVTFHNGNKFDADDVVSTVEFTKDAKFSFQFKTRYTWVKNVEKLGPYKVRIEAATPNAMDMSTIAYRYYIQDKESFDGLENKGDYGRLTPHGTGPYKVASIDKNAGIVVERFADFKGDKNYNRAPVGRIHGIPVPDPQTRVAKLLAGEIDMVRNVAPDTAVELAKNPDLGISNLPTGSFIFFGLDAAGRSGLKPLQDNRVRKAVFMAIDRDTIIKHIVPGGGIAEKMLGLCFKTNVACQFTNSHPSFDPAAAKKLLAEAGYANGFEMVYDCFTPIKSVCEAIAGELLKVGIKASINPTTIQVYRKKQGDGTQQAFSVWYPTAGHPDAGNILDVFFGGERDYAQDTTIHEIMKKGLLEFDTEKRAKIYEAAFNRNNEQHYVMAFSSLPTVYAHSKDIKIEKNQLSAGDYYINDYFWK